MTTVLAAGDSFVWGSELADSPHGGPDGYSRNTFAALLADRYICAAYPGLGNRDIAQRVRDHVAQTNNDIFVIVCWTWPSRDNQLTSDRDIVELQQYLDHHGIGYMFTCADNCVITHNPKINWDKWFLFPPAEEEWLTTDPRGFYQWAVENKYECGQQQHPLEDAHRVAAQLMQGKFNELVKKHMEQNCS
jgi:hypothetical protein